MRSRPLLLALALALSGQPLVAQTRPFLGVSAGTGSVPTALQDPCGAPRAHATLAAHLGVERGPLSLEGHGALRGPTPGVMCATEPRMREDGVHEETVYPFRRGELASADLRLRYRPLPRAPLLLTGGGGWLASHDLPYLLVGAGVRGRGGVRLTADVERAEFRVPYEVVVQEWSRYAVVRELGRERGRRWEGGWNARLGVEVLLRR